MSIDAPWLQRYGNIPHSLDYPDVSLSRLALDACARFPELAAYDFFGARVSFASFAGELERCARALKALGVAPGERVTVCMPNTPQAVVTLYALNLIGAVAVMTHPLSAPEELVFYLNSSRSVAAITLDQFYPKFEEILDRVPIKTLIVSGVEDALPFPKSALYRASQGRRIARPPIGGKLLRYSEFLRRGRDFSGDTDARGRGEDVAVILYSGGTSGKTKGILLTNLNLNALAMQTAAAGDCIEQGRKMLSIMPIFHGFGLGVCIHTALLCGVTCVLVPQFSVKSYARLLKKYRPHYIAGVPTLFEALLRLQKIEKLDLSSLAGVFSGGDSLSVDLKRRVDKFLKERGASVQVREGYGLTECVTASCLTPRDTHREGSIGIPFPDTYYKIVAQDTADALPYGETGELCISGPTVMRGYDNDPEETAQALREHADGRVWLHTGDLGAMDADGFIYFRGRAKRMIISSGYSVYPAQVEQALDAHEDVAQSCVIGVPDDYKIQRIKAYVVLRGGGQPTEATRQAIIHHCARRLARHAQPREYEFRDELPKTLVGKVAYAALEQEALAARLSLESPPQP